MKRKKKIVLMGYTSDNLTSVRVIITIIEDVIYEVCLQLNTARHFEDIIVQYQAETVYILSHEEYKVPESLLKKEDIRLTYEATTSIAEVAKSYQEMQKERSITDHNNFMATTKIDDQLIWLLWI
jgi:hypothetical protein